MQTDFKIRHREVAVVLSRSLEVRVPDLPSAIGSSFGDVYAYLGGHRIATSEEPFVIYHGQPGQENAPFPIQVCAPISMPMDPPSGWTCTTLPAGLFASVVHVGSYDSLGVAYDDLTAWIAHQGLVVAGPPREVYLSDPTTTPAETRTVVEFPVIEARAGVALATTR